MIKCENCNNENKDQLLQHDTDLVGYKDYGRFFTCLNCRKDFVLMVNEASDEEINTFNMA